jgi:hypothetical protein
MLNTTNRLKSQYEISLLMVLAGADDGNALSIVPFSKAWLR